MDIPVNVLLTASVPFQDVRKRRNIPTMGNVIMDILPEGRHTANVQFPIARKPRSINTMENITMDIPR